MKVDERQAHELALSTGWEYEELGTLTQNEYATSWDKTVDLLMGDHISTLFSDDRSREELLKLLPGADFMDTAFPPKTSSLYPVEASSLDLNGRRVSIKPLAFRRPLKFSQFLTIFGPRITAEDVVLGSLPDAWLISTVSNLADFPSLITALFPADFQTTISEGLYKVRLFRNGILTNVVIDDFFPCYLNAGPAYSR